MPASPPLSRRMVEYRGYWLANSFLADGAVAEYWACREKVAVIDLSALRKFEVLGPDAEALLRLCRDARRHQARGRPGRLHRDLPSAWRHARRRHGVPPGPAAIPPRSAAIPMSACTCASLAAQLGLKAWVRSSTDQLHNIAVQGPNSRELLATIIVTPATQPAVDRARLVPLHRRPARRHAQGRPSSSRAPAIRASSATRSGAIRATALALVGRGLRGRQAASASCRWGSRRSTCCASRPG